MKKIFILSVLTLFVLAACSSGPSIPQSEIDEFAKCITENGAIMYGTFWCPHCAKTKKMFGSSFQYVRYIECDPRGDNEQSELCIANEIDKYDTWEFNDDPSTRLVSEPSFADLSEKTGCAVPGGEQ